MAEKESNVVLNFKMDGQVEYANTVRDINAIMNAAASEYRTHVQAMGKDADATQKLSAEKKKLEIQLEAGQKRTEQLRAEYEKMANDTNTSTRELANKYKQLQNSERAELSLESALDRVNDGLSDQAIESRKAEEALNQLESESENLETQTEKLTAEYELQKAQLGENATEADKLKLEMEHLTNTHELAQQQVKNHEEQLEQAKRQYGENSTEVDKYETELLEAKTAEQQLANEIKATNDKLKNQEGALKKTSDQLKKTGDSMQKAGKKMTTHVTAPIVAVGGSALAAADKVDKAYREIRIGTGATGDDLEGLKDSFDEVFVDVPDDAEDVATALANLNTYTGYTDDALADLTKQTMDASRTLNEDGVSASEAFGKALNNWNIEAGDAEGHLDHLYTLTQNYGVGLGQLSELTTKHGTTLKNAGFEMGEVAHWMASLEANGIQVSRIMPGLNKATRDWADEGKNAKEELSNVIEEMKNAEDSTEALTIASEVFGSQGAQRMVDAVRSGALPAIEDLGDAFDQSSGVISEATEETRTMGEEFQILKNNTITALQPLGEIIMDLAKQAIPPLIDVITRVAEWFKNLSPEAQKMIVVIAGIAAAIGPVLVVLGTLIKSVGAIVGILPILGKAIAVLTGPIGLTVAAVAGLIAIFVRLYRNNEEFRDRVNSIWESIKESFSVALEFIKDIVHTVITAVTEFFGEQLEKIKEFWDENGQQIMELVQLYFGMVWEYIQMVLGWIKGVWEIAWTFLSTSLRIIWEQIKLFVKSGIDAVLGIIKTVLAVLRGDWSGAWDAIKETVMNIWDNIKTFFENVDLIQTGKDIINGLISGIGSMISSVGDAVKNIGNRIKDTFTNFFSIKSPSRVMKEIGEFLSEGLGLGIEDKADYAVNKSENVAKNVTHSMQDGIELPNMEIGTVVRQPNLASPTTQASAINNIGSSIKESLQGLSGDVNVTVYLDTDQVNTKLAPGMSKKLNNNNVMKARSQGVVMG